MKQYLYQGKNYFITSIPTVKEYIRNIVATAIAEFEESEGDEEPDEFRPLRFMQHMFDAGFVTDEEYRLMTIHDDEYTETTYVRADDVVLMGEVSESDMKVFRRLGFLWEGLS